MPRAHRIPAVRIMVTGGPAAAGPGPEKRITLPPPAPDRAPDADATAPAAPARDARPRQGHGMRRLPARAPADLRCRLAVGGTDRGKLLCPAARPGNPDDETAPGVPAATAAGAGPNAPQPAAGN
ncbi:MAG: hypothetical protein OXH51_06410 [Gemmatimonadetes bacterium]|nr:hypothetical protein [Gemmatimonadota bacterium]